MKKRFLDTVPIFVYSNDRVRNNIAFMIPITKKDNTHIIECINKDYLITLESGLTILPKFVQIFGDTKECPDHIIKSFDTPNMWFNALKNFKTRECNINDNGYSSITQYGKMGMIKLGIAMLGHPERVVVASVKYDHYIDSPFYNNIVKPITHG